MKFKKVAVSNRGEVAVRIIRALHEMGIKATLLHSEVDISSMAYREADETVCIGASPSSESYLNFENVLNAAVSSACEAIHPGFGFLSENADFVQACEKRRIIFIGPSADAIRSMGDKIKAKEIAKQMSVPTIPGYEGSDEDLALLKEKALEIGFPVLVKASAGGGGRGLKVARSHEELGEAVQSAKREAQSSFGNSRIFLEKYFVNAKHIEVQIFGDKLRVFHLGERECSVQRRHQKIIEESPSPVVNSEQRTLLGELSTRLAKAVGYRGAGTVEFLFSENRFYFMEMNTRLQVEHPVTEEVYGVDLVKAQISVAQDEPLYWIQNQLVPRGHSIECRIYAEDPYQNGVPSVGKLLGQRFTTGPGRRLELGFETGDEISTYYDSMIAKLIVRDETRSSCIRRMVESLKETIIFGVRTNIPLLKLILTHENFISGQMTTQFMSDFFSTELEENPPIHFQDISKVLKIDRIKKEERIINPFTGEWT